MGSPAPEALLQRGPKEVVEGVEGQHAEHEHAQEDAGAIQHARVVDGELILHCGEMYVDCMTQQIMTT